MLNLKNYIYHFFILIFLIFLIGCKKSSNKETDSRNETNTTKTIEISTKTAPISSKIVCDEFKIKWDLKGEMLDFWLVTDLPNEAEIMVSVSRVYWEKGNSATYSVDYFSEKSIVGKYRIKKQISVADSEWKKALKTKQNEMSGLGLGFEVGKIGNDIEIRFVVPIRQSSSKFGKENVNLEGKAVKTSGLRIVKDEIKITKKLGSKFSGGSSVSTSPLSLKVGITYMISKKTPLMPDLNPTNIELALSKMIELPPNSTIKILKVEKKNNSPWYNVDAKNKNMKIGTGWINSTALLGQHLKLIQ